MPRGVLVGAKAPIAQEYYAGVIYDGIAKKPTFVFSDMGGIDIEEVAEQHPDHIGRGHFSTILPHMDFIAKDVVASVGHHRVRPEPAHADPRRSSRGSSSSTT